MYFVSNMIIPIVMYHAISKVTTILIIACIAF